LRGETVNDFIRSERFLSGLNAFFSGQNDYQIKSFKPLIPFLAAFKSSLIYLLWRIMTFLCILSIISSFQ
jgi:hypothetical protein